MLDAQPGQMPWIPNALRLLTDQTFPTLRVRVYFEGSGGPVDSSDETRQKYHPKRQKCRNVHIIAKLPLCRMSRWDQFGHQFPKLNEQLTI